MTEPNPHACVVCAKRIPNRPNVCDGDRTSLDSMLGEIPTLYAQLDPRPAKTDAEKVSGSHQPPVPPNLDVVDLTSPSRQGSIGIRMAGDWSMQGGDPLQIGYLSVATELDFWVRDWITELYPDHHLPVPTVAVLAGWLRVRLDRACDEHPAVDEFAVKIRQIHRTLVRQIGEARFVHKLPAPCPTCDLVTLVRRDGASYVECTSCGRLWTEEEYRRLCIVLAAEQEVA